MADVQSLNLVVLVGRVSTDIQFDTGKGKDKNTSLARFSIATNEKFGQSPSVAQYHKVTVWGKKAEMCDRWLKKGRLVSIKGKLRHFMWQSDDGLKKKITVVNIDEITFLGKRDDFIEEGPTQEEPEHETKPDPF